MPQLPSAAHLDPNEERRYAALHALTGVIGVERRAILADVLTDADVRTLSHLVEQGMGPNTLRALTSDLAYLESWSKEAAGAPLPWPASEALILKFIAHHLWDPDERARNRTHGMPPGIEAALLSKGYLRQEGPHSVATVRRRLATWGTLHRWMGFASPIRDASVRSALRLAARASLRLKARKSARALTRPVLEQVLATCAGPWLRDQRDRALLLAAFASGGRRRSEIAGLKVEQLRIEKPVGAGEGEKPVTCLSIGLGRTKTHTAAEGTRVFVTGRAADELLAWLERAKITKGPMFRHIDRWGHVGTEPISPQAINLIVKQRAAKAGLDPREFSAHGLRSGFLTEAAGQGVPLVEAMQQSQHRSVQQAASYYNEVERTRSRAARLI